MSINSISRFDYPVIILDAVTRETIGERHASACRYKNEVPKGLRHSARRTHFRPRGVYDHRLAIELGLFSLRCLQHRREFGDAVRIAEREQVIPAFDHQISWGRKDLLPGSLANPEQHDSRVT